MRLVGCRSYAIIAIFVAVSAAKAGSADGFNYNRDTLSFANWTVFTYENGRIVSHKNKFGHHYSRRCFVMTRAVEQFYKFARFEPNASRLNEDELHKRIRSVTRIPPWHDPLPPEKRIVIPGYPNLRGLSAANTRLVQGNIGLGWVVYLRPGNVRMFYLHDKNYQEKTHDQLEQALACVLEMHKEQGYQQRLGRGDCQRHNRVERAEIKQSRFVGEERTHQEGSPDQEVRFQWRRFGVVMHRRGHYRCRSIKYSNGNR